MRISDWSSDVCSSDLVERDLFGDLPAALAVGLEHVLAAVGSRAGRQPHLVVGVGAVAGELLRVAFDQGAFAAAQVDPVQVVPLRVAVVHAHQHARSEEPTSELQSLMRTPYAVFHFNTNI